MPACLPPHPPPGRRAAAAAAVAVTDAASYRQAKLERKAVESARQAGERELEGHTFAPAITPRARALWTNMSVEERTQSWRDASRSRIEETAAASVTEAYDANRSVARVSVSTASGLMPSR